MESLGLPDNKLLHHPDGNNENPIWINDERCTLDGVEFFLATDTETLHKSQSTQDKFLLGKHRTMVEDMVAMRDNENIKRIVDIGIFKGGSMALYALLFTPTKLVGIEHTVKPEEPLERFIRQRGLQDNVRSYYGTSQADSDRVKKIVSAEFGDEALDLVVDDASHQYNETRASFEILFPMLRPGGLYIVEDWGWAHWQGDIWQKSQVFPNHIPSLTNLLIEICMLCASRPDLVANVQIVPSVIKVRRGGTMYKNGTFKLDRECLNRGKPFVPKM